MSFFHGLRSQFCPPTPRSSTGKKGRTFLTKNSFHVFRKTFQTTYNVQIRGHVSGRSRTISGKRNTFLQGEGKGLVNDRDVHL